MFANRFMGLELGSTKLPSLYRGSSSACLINEWVLNIDIFFKCSELYKLYIGSFKYLSNVLGAEIMAILNGIFRCLEIDLDPITMFSNSLLAIKFIMDLRGRENMMNEKEMKLFAVKKENLICTFNYIFRTVNHATHHLTMYFSG